ncbi:MAG: methionyl aminopeptidase [Prevotella sp.]|nr:methionyl aminopeptidase [Prevotella sp.]
MAIYLKTFEEIELIRDVGHTLGATFKEISSYIKPGASLLKLDRIAFEFIQKSGANPTLKKTQDLNKTTFRCILVSVNGLILDSLEEVYLKEGDIVKIDCQVEKWGFNAKACYTYGVGNLSSDTSHLIAQAKKSLDLGISKIKVGLRTGDVASAIKDELQASGYSPSGKILGHGIGREMKEDPIIPITLSKGKGPQIKVGMALTLGVKLSRLRPKTSEKPLVAEHLHTIIVGPNGAEVLT